MELSNYILAKEKYFLCKLKLCISIENVKGILFPKGFYSMIELIRKHKAGQQSRTCGEKIYAAIRLKDEIIFLINLIAQFGLKLLQKRAL